LTESLDDWSILYETVARSPQRFLRGAFRIDPACKQRLLTDATAATKEPGFSSACRRSHYGGA
jgi:hypothetical protein